MAWVQQKKVPIYDKLQDIQKQTYVTLKNIGSNSLKLDRFKNWSGKPLGDSFPDTLPPEGGTEFTHLRGRHGSVAAVQYSGLNMSGKTMAIIVAWKASSNYRPPNVPNRVYVTHGGKNYVNNLSWDEILLSLEDASSCASFTTIDHQAPDSAILTSNINFDLLRI